jgi:5-methyltetrahydrofolate--homocysteine methyltransferase
MTVEDQLPGRAAMDNIASLLNKQETILLDGAMGTLLIEAGMPQGSCPELWNVTHAHEVATIHLAYLAAGSQIILTNSFGGNPSRLRRHALENRLFEVNNAAAHNARQAIRETESDALVAGSIGPTGELMEPYGELTFEQAKQGFAEQAAALENGGVDLLWIETMSDLNEVMAAIEGIQSVSKLPFTATLTFDQHGRTMMGVSPEAALEKLVPTGISAIGANCGTGPEEAQAVIQTMAQADSGVPLIAKPNAGLPKDIDGVIVYDATPAYMAQMSLELKRAGARLIGGCCGTTPQHILEMGKTLNKN